MNIEFGTYFDARTDKIENRQYLKKIKKNASKNKTHRKPYVLQIFRFICVSVYSVA